MREEFFVTVNRKGDALSDFQEFGSNYAKALQFAQDAMQQDDTEEVVITGTFRLDKGDLNGG
jgi:hypothetical protein